MKQINLLKLVLILFAFALPIGLKAQQEVSFRKATTAQKLIDNLFTKGGLPPFSFTYGEESSEKFIRKWNFSKKRVASDDTNVIKYEITYSEPGGKGIEVKCDVAGFSDFEAVEWTLHFTNKGDRNSKNIKNVSAANILFGAKSGNKFTIFTARGSNGSRHDFAPVVVTPERDSTYTFSPKHGRSSDTDAFPFFNIATDGGRGAMLSIGWSGTWLANFTLTDGKLQSTSGMKNTDREAYEKLWADVKMFAEYAALCDRKFYERVRDSLLLPLTDGSHVTLAEYLDSAKEKHEGCVYYSTNKTAQAQYISMLEREGVKCAVLDKMIDTQFISMLEHENENVKFKRVDSDLSDLMGEKTEGEENERMTSLFRRVSGDEKLNVKCSTLKDETIPAVLTIDEEARRFDDMMKMYRAAGENLPEGMAPTLTLTLNLACPTVKSLDCEAGEREELIARQIYMLAILSQRGLSGEELSRFLSDSYEMLKRI